MTVHDSGHSAKVQAEFVAGTEHHPAWCEDYLPLYWQAVQEVGSASIVLARCLSQGNTIFCRMDNLFEDVGVSLRTGRRHIEQLVQAGYLIRQGRQNRRRTATYLLSSKAKGLRGTSFGRLPLWVCRQMTGWPWSMKVVLAYIVSQHGIHQHVEDQNRGSAESITWMETRVIAKRCGLSTKRVDDSLRLLESAHAIEIEEFYRGSQDIALRSFSP